MVNLGTLFGRFLKLGATAYGGPAMMGQIKRTVVGEYKWVKESDFLQGMIADTGGEWKLFEHHKTIGMITEYIFHPFAHLMGGHSHHDMMDAHTHNPGVHNSPAMKRRIIFIELSGNTGALKSPFDDFDINAKRTPLFFVDVHLHTGEILQVKDTPSGSGWGTVPTPMF